MIDKAKNIEILWKAVRDTSRKTMMDALGIEITYIGEDKLTAKMPVDGRTHQYYGMLHGGASVALAETLVSMGALIFADSDTKMVVGQEINANHIFSATDGFVYAEAKPIHVGKSSQVWQAEIRNEAGKLLCISRCTIAVIDKR